MWPSSRFGLAMAGLIDLKQTCKFDLIGSNCWVFGGVMKIIVCWIEMHDKPSEPNEKLGAKLERNRAENKNEKGSGF
jgi:hypothetical protein